MINSSTLVDIGGKRVLQFDATGPALATGQDTNDLISAAWEHEAEWLAAQGLADWENYEADLAEGDPWA